MKRKRAHDDKAIRKYEQKDQPLPKINDDDDDDDDRSTKTFEVCFCFSKIRL